MRILTVITVGLLLFGASSPARSEDAKTKELAELCAKYRAQAQGGKPLQPNETAIYLLCVKINPLPPSFVDPDGHFNSIVQVPPTTYRDSDGCLRQKTTNMIIECLM